MYSILVGCSRIPANHLSHTGCVATLSSLPAETFLPKACDICAVKANMVILVSRSITQYTVTCYDHPRMSPSTYSKEMRTKSEVVVLDVLMKNEAKHSDMIDIMHQMHEYLGQNYPSDRRIPSGRDQLTCERQVGAQHHTTDGDTVHERLGLLELVTEDWHCLVCLLSVSGYMYIHIYTCLPEFCRECTCAPFVEELVGAVITRPWYTRILL